MNLRNVGRWLGPNGLPLSPRKQRGLLFQFCTTNFVTEAEMRYCYARLLSVGNPSGPVKFSGQPQYDSVFYPTYHTTVTHITKAN